MTGAGSRGLGRARVRRPGAIPPDPSTGPAHGNHTWLIPTELTRALDALASGFGDRRTQAAAAAVPQHLYAQSGDSNSPGASTAHQRTHRPDRTSWQQAQRGYSAGMRT